jgi:osmoprotectant transport system substrate-binding protein
VRAGRRRLDQGWLVLRAGARGSIRLTVLAVLAGLAVLVAGCASGRPPAPTPPQAGVVVASFNFAESELLAEIYAQALQQAGIPVRLELDLGPRELVQPAARQGLVDLVPEYLGTALSSVAPDTVLNWNDPVAVRAALSTALRPLGEQPLAASGAADQNGFAVTDAFARRFGLHSLSDLAAVPGQLTVGGPTECPTRPFCLAGLHRTYQLGTVRFLPFDDAGQRAAALSEGLIDIAVTFSTDGWLATGQFRLLADDRHLQPSERVVPVVSDRGLARYGPKLRATLDAVSAALDTASLRFMNWRVGVLGKSVQAEAAGWLHRHPLRSTS